MNKLLSLLKASMSSGIQLFNYRGKTERSRRNMPILLGILFGVMMFFSASSLMVGLKEGNAESVILSLYVIITSLIILMEGSYKSIDLLFKPRDNDFLLSLPLSKSAILFTRIVKFYLFELVYCLIFLLPAILAYATNTPTGPSFYLVAITMIILVPIIPIAISCIIGLIISAISSRFKHRSILQTILSLITLIVTALLFFTLSSSQDPAGQSLIRLADQISGFYYPAASFVSLSTDFNLLQYLVFIGVNLAVLAVAVILISFFYTHIISRFNVVKQTTTTNSKSHFTRHSQTTAIIKKEFVKYFNTPVLLTNTAFGLILFLVAVVLICINYDNIVTSIVSSGDDFPLTAEQIYSFLPSVTFVMVSFASLLTFISSTMISLEGKTINFLKSLPISGHKIIATKVLAAMLLILPATILGSFIMAIRFRFSLLEISLILVATVATSLMTELIGILIDLKYARFDAENDAVTVKQSASTLVSTFLGLGVFLVTISLAFALIFFVGQIPGLAMLDAIFVVNAAFLHLVVATRGEAKYRKLSA